MAPKRGGRLPDAALPEEIIDFRYGVNDSWYSVVPVLEGGDQVLRVMYANFSERYDERYRADRFESEEELEKFAGRFRRGSVQLQDEDCGVVEPGMVVTVSHAFGPQDVRFYDAVIDSVDSKVHPLAEGKCSCTFVVRWQHGPLVGNITSIGIENICLLQPKSLKMDPTVMKFLDIARQKVEERKSLGTQTAAHIEENSMHVVDNNIERSSNSPVCLGHDAIKICGSPCSSRPHGSSVGSRLSKCRYAPSWLEDEETSKKVHAMRHAPKEKIINSMPVDDISCEKVVQPNNGRHYFFRIENLERNISAFDVMDFLLEKTFVTCHAFICPTTLEEFFSKATILVETEEEANKLFEFLHDSSHIITSSGGRPWITKENWCGCVDGSMPRYEMAASRNRSKGYRSKLKLVYRGTKEYEQASLLQAYHIEFHDHVHKKLLRRLMEDEKKCIHLTTENGEESQCDI